MLRITLNTKVLYNSALAHTERYIQSANLWAGFACAIHWVHQSLTKFPEGQDLVVLVASNSHHHLNRLQSLQLQQSALYPVFSAQIYSNFYFHKKQMCIWRSSPTQIIKSDYKKLMLLFLAYKYKCDWWVLAAKYWICVI